MSVLTVFPLYVFASNINGIIDIIGSISINGLIFVIASNLPVITPNDPPDTNIAAGDSFPFENLIVSSAPDICKKALPKHIITSDIYTDKLVKPNIKYDITKDKISQEEKGIYIVFSFNYSIHNILSKFCA